MKDTPSSKRLFYVVVFIILCIPVFLLSVREYASITGDDYAQYVKQAINIAQGKPYHETNYLYNPLDKTYAPPQYPIGFSLLLAPFVKLFGADIRVLLSAQAIICVLFGITCLFYFARNMRLYFALCLSIICVYSLPFLYLTSSVLSDVACALFVMIYILMRERNFSNIYYRFLLPLVLVFGMLIRTQVVLLVVAEGLYFLLFLASERKKHSLKGLLNHISLSVIISSLLLYFILTRLVFPAPGNTESFYLTLFDFSNTDLKSLFLHNLRFLVSSYRYVFGYTQANSILALIAFLFMNLLPIAAIVGFYLKVKRKIVVSDMYFVLNCLMILLLQVYQGFRYLSPTLPMYLLYAFLGVQFVFNKLSLSPKWKMTFATVVIFSFAVLTFDCVYNNNNENDALGNSFYSPNDKKAFELIKTKVPDTSIILFSKPRALTLYTNKRSMVMLEKADTQTYNQIKSIGADYFLTRKNLNDSTYSSLITSLQIAVDTIPVNEYYTLYKIK